MVVLAACCALDWRALGPPCLTRFLSISSAPFRFAADVRSFALVLGATVLIAVPTFVITLDRTPRRFLRECVNFCFAVTNRNRVAHKSWDAAKLLAVEIIQFTANIVLKSTRYLPSLLEAMKAARRCKARRTSARSVASPVVDWLPG